MPRSLKRVLVWCYVAALTIYQLRMPRVGNPLDVDCGWQGLLQHDWHEGARSGVDSVFTYGPAGFLLAQSMFSADGLWPRYLLGLVLAVVFAAAQTSLAWQMPTRRWRIVYLVCLLLLAPYTMASGMFYVLTTLGIVSLLAMTRVQRAAEATFAVPELPPAPTQPASFRPGAWLLLAGAMIVLAVAGQAKFTYFALGGAVVAAIAVSLAAMRRTAAAVGAVALYGAIFCALWLAFGQSLQDLPTWLHASGEIASGYNDSMGLVGDDAELHWGLSLFAANVLLAVLLLALPHPDTAARGLLAPGNLRRWAAGAIALLGLFLVWKGGFVRHDSGHTVIFFGFAAMCPFLALAAAQRPLPLVANLAVALAIATGAYQTVGTCIRCRTGFSIDDTIYRIATVVAPTVFVADLEQRFDLMHASPPLPQMRARIGTAPVDLVGNVQGLAFATDLQVRHRPVFQSYSAYTPFLQRLNGDFLAAAGAPAHLLANLQSIDGRYPLVEDSQAWKAVLYLYHPAMIEQDILLLERNADAAAPPPARTVFERTIQWDEWIEVPDEADWHELSLGIDYTLTGRALAAALRPSFVYLDVRVARDQGRTEEFGGRISPELARAPFVLDPLIRNNLELARTWQDQSPARVRAFRVRTESGGERYYRRRGIEARLEARPVVRRPSNADEVAAIANVANALTYPQFNWYPFKTVPPNGVTRHAGGGVLAHAPCRLSLRWPGGRHRLTARFEIPAGAWEKTPSCTDGAEFRVEVPGAPQPVAFQRLLLPHLRAEDRGVQSFELDLDLLPDQVVELVTDPGPAGKANCDWTIWRSVELSPP